ncbi:MAG: hypothetical protein K5841_06865 [Fretibacterium sp.]|nr:hypothetical protein [Fretibacterium sp.]
MDKLKDVFLSIGKGSYSIRTPLNEEDMDRVKRLIHQASPHPGNCDQVPFRGMDQEILLVLTCLQLAYKLDSVTAKLEELSKHLGIAPEESEEPEEPEKPEEFAEPKESAEPEEPKDTSGPQTASITEEQEK